MMTGTVRLAAGVRRTACGLATIALCSLGLPARAQTTTAGPAIDVEIYNPADGSNQFCVDVNQSFDARVLVHPGSTSTTCALACSGGSPTIPGGSANLATGIIDIAFDTSRLSLMSFTNNPSTAAADGLIQNNAGQGRIGWALAGDWTTDADPSSALKNPCNMGFLTLAGWTPANGWVVEATFQALAVPGTTSLHIRRESDPAPFGLSFADICGGPAFKQSTGGIDEVVDASVIVSSSCTSLLFFDGFESSSTIRWAHVVP